METGILQGDKDMNFTFGGLTEMGRFIWITQRNHSSLQIQAARLAHIPL